MTVVDFVIWVKKPLNQGQTLLACRDATEVEVDVVEPLVDEMLQLRSVSARVHSRVELLDDVPELELPTSVLNMVVENGV